MTILVAFLLIVLLGIAALVVDIGMQRVARADMQALADVVALDLARELDGRTAEVLQPVMVAAADESVERNPGVVGDVEDVTIVPELGQLTTDGDFDAVSGDAVPDAVRVEAGTEVAFAFAGITGVAEGGAERRAVSTAQAAACFRLGSFAAALNTGDSAIIDVFESLMKDPDALGVNLRAIGYQGLLTSFVDLPLLASELGVGTVDALVAQGDVSVANLLSASARALNTQGETAASAILGTIAANVAGTVTANITDILAIGQGSALTGTVNAADLVGWAGLAAALNSSVADSSNFLSTGVVWSVPHTSSGEVSLTVIESPRQACGRPGGPERASTGQLQLVATPNFNLPGKLTDAFKNLSVGNIDNPLATQTEIEVVGTMAGAEGRLTGLNCLSDRREIQVGVETRLTDLSVSLPFRVKGQMAPLGIVPKALYPPLVPESLLKLELDLVLEARTALSTIPGTASPDTVYSVPPRTYLDPEPSAGSASYLELEPPVIEIDYSRSTAKLVAVGVNVNLSLNALDLSGLVTNASSGVIGTSVTAVVQNVNAALLPLAELLGLRVAGADVYGVPTISCGSPRLVE